MLWNVSESVPIGIYSAEPIKQLAAVEPSSCGARRAMILPFARRSPAIPLVLTTADTLLFPGNSRDVLCTAAAVDALSDCDRSALQSSRATRGDLDSCEGPRFPVCLMPLQL